MILEIFSSCSILIVPIISLVVFVLLLRLVVNWDRWKKEGSERARRKVKTLTVTIIVIVATTSALYILADQTRHRVVYTATVTGGDVSGVVYIPVTMNEELQDEIRVVSGDGRMSIVDTVHGKALRLRFSGTVVVEGRVVGSEYFTDWRLSMVPDDNRSRIAWAGLETNNGENNSVELELDIDSHLLTGCDSGYSVDAQLWDGWNTCRISGYIV